MPLKSISDEQSYGCPDACNDQALLLGVTPGTNEACVNFFPGRFLALAAAMFTCTIQGASFVAEGFLVCRFYVQGELVSESTNQFVAAVRDCQSMIKVDRSKSNNGIRYHKYVNSTEASFNLTIYGGSSAAAVVRRIDRETGKLMEVESKELTRAINKATVIVNASSLPPNYTMDFLTPVWTAFASRCFLPGEKGMRRLSPIYPLGENSQARQLFSSAEPKVLTKWENDTRSGLVKELKIFRGNKITLAKNDEVVQEDLPEYLTQFSAVYSYRAEQWGKFDGTILPREFIVERISLAVKPTPDIAPPHLIKKATYQGVVTNATRSVTEAAFKADIPPLARVVENRLAFDDPPVKGVDYLTHDGAILPLEKVKQLDKYKFIVENTQRRGSRSWTAAIIMVLILVVFAAVPVLFWIRAFINFEHKGPRQTQTTE